MRVPGDSINYLNPERGRKQATNKEWDKLINEKLIT